MEFQVWRNGLWVEVWGRVFYLSYNPDYTLLFSERYGYKKVYRFAGFVFKTMRRA